MRSHGLFLSLYLPAFLLGTGRGFIAPVLPLIARDQFDASVGAAALIALMMPLGAMAITVPAGYAMDRFGRKAMLVGGPLLSVVIAFQLLRVDSYDVFLVYIFLDGLARQVWQMSRLAVIADTGVSDQRGRQITGMSGARRVGTLAGPLAGGLVAAVFGLRAPFVAYAAFSLAAAAVTYLTVKESAPAVLERRARRAGIEPPPDPVGPAREKWLSRRVMLFFSSYFVANVARGGTDNNGGSFFVFAAYVFGAGPLALGALSMANGIASLPMVLVGGQVMDRLGRKRVVLPAMLGIAVGLVLMATTAAAQLPLWAFVASFVVVALSQSFMGGSMQTIASDMAPPRSRGQFLGVSRLVGEGGSLGNPGSFAAITSLVGGSVGFAAAFAFTAAAALTTAMIVGLGLQETLQRESRTREPRP